MPLEQSSRHDGLPNMEILEKDGGQILECSSIRLPPYPVRTSNVAVGETNPGFFVFTNTVNNPLFGWLSAFRLVDLPVVRLAFFGTVFTKFATTALFQLDGFPFLLTVVAFRSARFGLFQRR